MVSYHEALTTYRDSMRTIDLASAGPLSIMAAAWTLVRAGLTRWHPEGPLDLSLLMLEDVEPDNPGVSS